MLARRIIVCLDVKDGRVVKGVKFEGLRDAGDPVSCAARYDAEGADEITFLDITASNEQRRIILDVVERTAAVTAVPLTVGGGVRERRDAADLFLAGADKVAINTRALEDPSLVDRLSDAYGAQAIVVALDARREGDGFAVYTHGGRKKSSWEAVAWAREVASRGAGELLVTSMDRDGTRIGYDLELTRQISEAVSIPVIASGGVGTLEHLYEGLTEGRADAVLAASIFHEGQFTIGEAKRYLLGRGTRVRPLEHSAGDEPR